MQAGAVRKLITKRAAARGRPFAGSPRPARQALRVPADMGGLLGAQSPALTAAATRFSGAAIAISVGVNAAIAAAALNGLGLGAGAGQTAPVAPLVILVKPPTLPMDVLRPPALDAVPRAALASACRQECRPEPVPLVQPPELQAPAWLSAAPSPALLPVAATDLRVPAVPPTPAGFGDTAPRTPPPAQDTDSEARYWEDVRRRVAAEIRYPVEARRRGISGDVTLCVAVNARGMLIEARPVAQDGLAPELSGAALAAARRAAPFPPPSFAAGAGTNMVVALLPIRFELVEREANKTKEQG